MVTNASKYSSSSAIQKNGSAPMNCEPSVTTESNRELRRHAANAPSIVPIANPRICVTPTSTSVHGSASPIMCVTGYGK